MTPQEVSEFVNQPAPRRVPTKISRKVTSWRGILPFVTIMLLIPVLLLGPLLIIARSPFYSDIENRATAHGSIISITPEVRLWGIGPTSYTLTARFYRPRGYITVNSLVWGRRNIPGWGIIPETQNNPRRREILTLAEPFPVAIEYLRNRPSIARIVGTRFPGDFSEFIDVFIVFSLIIVAAISVKYLEVRKAMLLLRKGAFTSGYISKRPLVVTSYGDDEDPKQDYVASFTDLRGVKCKGHIVLPSDEEGNQSWLYLFAYYGQPVGLLYLPDTEAVIVTDLWLDYYPDPNLADKAPNSEHEKSETAYEKDKAAFLEHTKDMTYEEFIAEQEEISAKITDAIDKIDEIDKQSSFFDRLFPWHHDKYDRAFDELKKYPKYVYTESLDSQAVAWKNIENLSQEEIKAKLDEIAKRRDRDKQD